MFGSRAGYITQAAPVEYLFQQFQIYSKKSQLWCDGLFDGQSQSRDSNFKDDVLDISSTDKVVFKEDKS